VSTSPWTPPFSTQATADARASSGWPCPFPVNRLSPLKLPHTRRAVRDRATQPRRSRLRLEIETLTLRCSRQRCASNENPMARIRPRFRDCRTPFSPSSFPLSHFRFCLSLTPVHQALVSSLEGSQPLFPSLFAQCLCSVGDILQRTRRRRRSPSTVSSVACLSS
jgi:hypothetical protein